MGVSIDMMRQGAVGGEFPQSFTVPGFGTVKAAIIIATRAVTNATKADHANMSIGFLDDGNRTFCISSGNDDGVTPLTNTYHQSDATAGTGVSVILFATGGGIATKGTASVIADGIQISWAPSPPVSYLVTVILFGGSDVTARVGEWTSSASNNTNTFITDTGFIPEVLFVITNLTIFHNTLNSGFAEARLQFGFARNTGASPNQMCAATRSQDNVSPAFCWNHVQTTGLISKLNTEGIEILSFDANGFTATTRGAGLARLYGYLALKFNGTVMHQIQNVAAPTGAIGERSVTVNPPAFKPQFVLQLTSATLTANNTGMDLSSEGAGSFGIAAFTASKMFSNTVSDDDQASALAPSRIGTESFSSNDFRCRLDSANSRNATTGVQNNFPPNDPMANAHVAAAPPVNPLFTSTGWTLDYSVIGVTTTRQWPTLAIGEFIPPATSSVPVFDHYYRQRRAW